MMKRYIPFVLLLIFLLTGCTPTLPSTQSSDTAGTTEYVPITVPTASLPAIPEGTELRELEEKWLDYFKRELIWYDSALNNNLEGARNYGSYEGYTVIFDRRGAAAIETGVHYTIAGKTFWDSGSFILWAYKDAKFVLLEELYAEGKISEAAITQCYEIHQWYTELLTRAYIEPLFKQAFDQEIIWYDEDAKNGVRYYGALEYFSMYDIVLFVPYAGNSTEIVVDSTTFTSCVPFEIYVYRDKFYKLSDYFAEDFLPRHSIEQLSIVHDKYEQMLAKEE